MTFLGWSYIHGQNCNVVLGPDVYVCAGSGPVTITANATGQGTVTYSWTINNNPIGGNNSTLTVTSNGVNNPDVIEGFVTYTSNGNTCNDDNTLNIYTLDPGVIGSAQTSCTSPFNPSQLTNITSGTNSLGGNNTNYSWQSSNDGVTWNTIQNATNSTYNPPSTSNTIFFRRVISISVGNNNYTCYSNVISVLIVDSPTINNPLCVNNGTNANLSVLFNPALTSGFTATYAWTGPSGYTANTASPVVNAVNTNKTGTYNCLVTVSYGGNVICSYTLSTTINLIPPTPTFSFPSSGCQGNSYIPTNFTPQPNTSYLWSISPQTGSGGSTGLTTANPNFVFNNVGSYAITVTATLNGCSTTSNAQNISMSNFNIDPPSVQLNGTYYNVQVINGQNTIAICAGLSNTNINILNNNISPNCSGGACNPSGVTYTFSINGSNPAPFGAQVSGTINYGNNNFVITATY